MRKVIYLDMDGVLADFDKQYFRNGRKSFEFEEFEKEVMDNALFLRLEKMPDFEELITGVFEVANEYGFDVEICSSVHALAQTMIDYASEQKRQWLIHNNLKSLKTNFVERKSGKARFADENTILIDDSIECITYFTEAGGNAICHKNAASTVVILKKLAKKISPQLRVAS